MEITNTLGRRKTAVARVYLQNGKGEITVNGRDFKEYFRGGVLQYKVTQAFTILNLHGQYDVNVNVAGGGITGQAESVRLGIARALIALDPECKSKLRAQGLVTRDPRMVERKKPGQKKARKKFQFSKR
jgi:small subunit ribosomal protein S9